jgi:hypothetical protein
MWLSRLALIVALYVSLDVANPMMPGALVFGVQESVEARQGDRFRAHDEAPLLALAPERLDSVEPIVVPNRMTRAAPRAPEAHVTRSRLSLQRPDPSPEDH